MHIAQDGVADGTPVLFLHGAGFAGSMWQPLTTELTDLRLLIPDLPGHGKSVEKRFVSFEDTALALAREIRKVGIDEPMHVVGISLGAYVGLMMALRHPRRVKSAFLSGFHTGNMPRPGFMKVMGDVMSPVASSRWFRMRMAKSLGAPDDLAVNDQVFAAPTNARTIRTVNRAAVDFDQNASLAGIEAPVLAIAGGKEHELIRTSLKRMARDVKNSQARLVPHLGHGWPIQNPDLFTRTLRSWISETDLPSELETVSPQE